MPDEPLSIRKDDLAGKATLGLVRAHLEGMYEHSPPGSVYALDLSGLLRDDVTVWSAWFGDEIAGMAALREIDRSQGELKSMRTRPVYLRRGVAAALLEHIIGVATDRGMERLSLETGSGPAFEPALALYRRRGFVDGEAFGTYRQSEFNRFLHLSLKGGSST